MLRSRRGFMMVDMMMGFLVITLLIYILTTSIGRHRWAIRQQADRRTATRLCEQMAMSMQQGLAWQAEDARVSIDVKRDGVKDMIDGQVWVLITTRYREAAVELNAVVPEATFRKYEVESAANKGANHE